MSNKLIEAARPQERVINTGTVGAVEPRHYLPDWRLAEIRTKAEGYLLNNGGPIAVYPNDLLALVDEVRAGRARPAVREPENELAAPPERKRGVLRRLIDWLFS